MTTRLGFNKTSVKKSEKELLEVLNFDLIPPIVSCIVHGCISQCLTNIFAHLQNEVYGEMAEIFLHDNENKRKRSPTSVIDNPSKKLKR